MLLAFAGNWDATAIGTLALAVVTGVSLVFGWKSLRQGQREVEEAHRPVVMPIVRKTTMDLGADGQHEISPKLLNSGHIVVPVENIGSGPALNL